MDWHEATEFLDNYCSERDLQWIHNETECYCAIVSLEHNEMLQIRASEPTPEKLAARLQEVEAEPGFCKEYDPPPYIPLNDRKLLPEDGWRTKKEKTWS